MNKISSAVRNSVLVLSSAYALGSPVLAHDMSEIEHSIWSSLSFDETIVSANGLVGNQRTVIITEPEHCQIQWRFTKRATFYDWGNVVRISDWQSSIDLGTLDPDNIEIDLDGAPFRYWVGAMTFASKDERSKWITLRAREGSTFQKVFEHREPFEFEYENADQMVCQSEKVDSDGVDLTYKICVDNFESDTLELSVNHILPDKISIVATRLKSLIEICNLN